MLHPTPNQTIQLWEREEVTGSVSHGLPGNLTAGVCTTKAYL